MADATAAVVASACVTSVAASGIVACDLPTAAGGATVAGVIDVDAVSERLEEAVSAVDSVPVAAGRDVEPASDTLSDSVATCAADGALETKPADGESAADCESVCCRDRLADITPLGDGEPVNADKLSESVGLNVADSVADDGNSWLDDRDSEIDVEADGVAASVTVTVAVRVRQSPADSTCCGAQPVQSPWASHATQAAEPPLLQQRPPAQLPPVHCTLPTQLTPVPF